ncbi:MAG: SIMPL domain-containing protein [Limnochordia bacterium]|jgi:uncharacterized protein YggE
MRKLILLAVSLLLALAAPSFSAPFLETQSLVSVGSGFVVCTADTAVVSLAIESTAKQSGVAQNQNQTIIDQITQALLAESIPGLGFEVRQATFWETTDLTSREKSYKVSSGLDVRIQDLERVGEVVDIALKQGATSVQGVRFELSDLESVAQTALKKAVENAIEKANMISKAAGLRVTMVREMRDTNTIRVHNPSLPTGASMSEAPLPPLAGPIYRGQIMVHAEVTVVFDIALDRSL